MFINFGLWNLIKLDGIEGALSKTHKGTAFLVIFGPERVAKDPYSAYSPVLSPVLKNGLPDQNDQSEFAILYRKLESFVHAGTIVGPRGEDHPAVFRRFIYTAADQSPAELLSMLEASGIQVLVKRIDHQGDQAEVVHETESLKRWIDENTEFAPDPKVVKAKQDAQQHEDWQVAVEKAKRMNDILRRFVFYPVLGTVLLALYRYVFPTHPVIAGIGMGFCAFLVWFLFVGAR
ncbi:MAG TPA: hypothetical protein VIR98_00390 [Candidatus Paceibacterota bacterium]|jgi:hypothetical protein